FDRGLGHNRPPQVRRQHGPRKVEDGPEIRSCPFLKTRGHAACEVLIVGKIAALARFGEHLAHGRNDGGVSETLLCLNQCGVPNHLVDRGNLAQCGGPNRDRIMPTCSNATHNSRTLRVTWSLGRHPFNGTPSSSTLPFADRLPQPLAVMPSAFQTAAAASLAGACPSLPQSPPVRVLRGARR